LTARFDRILDEAHASGGDIRRLMGLFSISVETAHRYVRTVVKRTRPDDRGRPVALTAGARHRVGERCQCRIVQ
jgi:hypothetical protein